MNKTLHQHQLTDAADVRTFMLAGKARFTLRSKRTGTRFTFRVSAPKDEDPIRFVKVLTGPDNEQSYRYAGVLRDGKYCHGRKAKIGADAPSVKAIDWFCRKLAETQSVPAEVEFWHEGKCCRCGRALTVPESIKSGVGPECAKHVRPAADLFAYQGA